MAITQAVGRIAATLVAIVQTRLELAAVEMQEESRRLLGLLVMSLLAVFLLGVAIVLVALFVIILFWDSHRIAAVLGLIVVFGGGAAIIAMKVLAAFKAHPGIMAATAAELRKDAEYLKTAGHSHEY